MKPLHTYALAVLILMLPVCAAASPRQEVLAGPVTGKVLQVMDGDTVSVRVRVWIGQELETHVRFAGIDAPEIHGKCAREREMAAAARAEVTRLVGGGDIILSDIQLEKYAGRVLATVQTKGGVSIADHLIRKGFARPYGGKKRLGWCS